MTNATTNGVVIKTEEVGDNQVQLVDLSGTGIRFEVRLMEMGDTLFFTSPMVIGRFSAQEMFDFHVTEQRYIFRKMCGI